MKRLFSICFIILFALSLSGNAAHLKQKPYKKGILVFHNGDTLQCTFKFTRKVSEGLVEALVDQHIEIFTVKDIRSFSFFDEKRKAVRTFVNVPFTPELSTRKHEVFVEYLYGNEKLTILNHKTIGFASNLQLNPFRSKTIVNNRYVLDNCSGEVVPMSKEDVMMLMKSAERQVNNYIQTSGIRMKSVEDFIAVLDYYASL